MTESNRIEFKRELTRELDIEREEVADALGVTSRTIQTDFSKLLEIGVLERVGSDKNGEWKSLIS